MPVRAQPARRTAASFALRAALVSVVALCVGTASGQAQRLAGVELGFAGTLVANAWNPLRLTLRDVGPVVLEVVIDQGSLRDGTIPLVYRATVAGGSGLSVFDDELFVPIWRSLTWTVRSGATTLASGSVPRGDADRRAVDVVVTEAPGPWRARLGDQARVVDVPAERLVARSAAYDGVRALIVAGDGDPPRTAALVAAAAAGAIVVLSDVSAALPALAALAPPADEPWRRVGAGWIVLERALEPGVAVLEAARTDHAATVSAFAAVDRLVPPRSESSITLLFGASIYALAVLIVLRFGGLPGIVAAAAIVIAGSFVAWAALRPSSPTLQTTRDVVIGGNGIGQRWRVHDLVSLPASEVRLDAAVRPIGLTPLTTGPDGTSVPLARWRGQQLVERPRVADVWLRWEGRDLVNDGPRPLTEVRVRGGDVYDAIAPGGTGAIVSNDASPPSAAARALFDVIPAGTAIAFDGATWFVALASEPREARAGGLD